MSTPLIQVGNVYIKFRREKDATAAVKDLNNRWFGGRPIYAELSPVTDFREACCRKFHRMLTLTSSTSPHIACFFFAGQYEMGECTRAGFCNFMHLKPISRELRAELYGRKRKRSRSRSRSRDDRSRRRGRHRSRSPREDRSPPTRGSRERSGRF